MYYAEEEAARQEEVEVVTAGEGRTKDKRLRNNYKVGYMRVWH